MTDEIDSLINQLVEGDEEEVDASLAKDLSNNFETDLEDWLIGAGFKREEGVWVKRTESKTATVAKIPHGYSIGFYGRGTTGWLSLSRAMVSGAGVRSELRSIAELPVKENLDNPDDAEFKDVIDISRDKFPEIYQLLDAGILDMTGKIGRTDTRYVHERSTYLEYYSVDWNWPEPKDETQAAKQQAVENRSEHYIGEIGKEIDAKMVAWNKKIYRELEQAYEYATGEEAVSENIRANDYDFHEDGKRSNQGTFKYDQLTPEAQETARQWYIEAMDQDDWDWMSESVIAEWKWLLKNKGFNGVEIAWSGFSNQGDGASFTAKSIDFKLYLTGPDPMEFPESNREQLSEGEEEGDIEPKEFYGPERKKITHIQTTSDYIEYQTRVADFFRREGISNLSAMQGPNGNIYQNEFSRTPCDVCHRPLAGIRTQCSGYNPITHEIKEYWVCPDCEYYAEYGTLDDMTMMDLKDDTGNIHEADESDLKDVLSTEEIPTFTLCHHLGELTVRLEDGLVTECHIEEPGDPDWLEDEQRLEQIEKIDIQEWQARHGRRIAQDEDLDLLNFAYWMKDGTRVLPPGLVESVSDDPEIKELAGEPPPDPIFSVNSSHGDLTALVDDGTVTGVHVYTPGDPDGEALKQIARLDVGEWRRFYRLEKIRPDDSIDILDFGYWLKDGTYEPPLDDWRAEFAELRHHRQNQEPLPGEGI